MGQTNQHSYSDELRKEVVEKFRAGATMSDLIEEYGISKDSVRRWSNREDFIEDVEGNVLPKGHMLKGGTFQYRVNNETGEHKLERYWAKSKDLNQDINDIAEGMVEGLAAELPTIPPLKQPTEWNSDLAVVIPIGDAHIGMYASKAETGDQFDLDIARKELCAAFDYLIDQNPHCERAIIANVGDFMHYHAMEAATERSGHILDASGRPQEMVKVAVSALRYCIEKAAQKHKYVDVINSSGNHDGLLAHVMNVMLENIYSENERITVHSQPTSRHYIQHGKVLIGVVHGHQTKDKDLPIIMAKEMPVAWGETEHRVWFRGHHHHDSRIEHNGAVVVEQVRTLAAKDAYAYNGGYIAGRDLKSIIFHKEYGEQGRFVCGIEMIRAML